MANAWELYERCEAVYLDIAGGLREAIVSGRSTDFAAGVAHLRSCAAELSELLPQLSISARALSANIPDRFTSLAGVSDLHLHLVQAEVPVDGRTDRESMDMRITAYERGMRLLVDECTGVADAVASGDLRSLLMQMSLQTPLGDREGFPGSIAREELLAAAFSLVGRRSVPRLLPVRGLYGDSIRAAMRRQESDLEAFLVETFGEHIDVGRLGEYIQERGNIWGLRRIENGYSSVAVVELDDVVMKLDSSEIVAQRQRHFHSLDFDELQHYVPQALSDSVTEIGGVFAWEMTKVPDNTKGNLFDRSKLRRVRLTDDSFKVVSLLEKDLRYTTARKHAQEQGAASLYDFIDHAMYVLGLFHKEATEKFKGNLPVGPKPVEQRMAKLVQYNDANLGTYSDVKMMFSQTAAEARTRLRYATARLREGADTVIHGDTKVENIVDGALIDPFLRYGKEIEDLAKLLNSGLLGGLSQGMVQHFIGRYIQHRSRHDLTFRDSPARHQRLFADYNCALYVQKVREVSAMHSRNLLIPHKRQELYAATHSARAIVA